MNISKTKSKTFQITELICFYKINRNNLGTPNIIYLYIRNVSHAKSIQSTPKWYTIPIIATILTSES